MTTHTSETVIGQLLWAVHAKTFLVITDCARFLLR